MIAGEKHGPARAVVRQPTDAELADRVLMCRRLLSQGQYDGQVKNAVAAHYGLSPRTVERYLRRARDEMVAETGRDRGELRAESYGFYREVRGDPAADRRDRLKAAERIDKLLGLETPQQVQVTGADGGPLLVREVVVRTREEAQAAMGKGDG